jgi:EamA domain-containing membrane protein RarD
VQKLPRVPAGLVAGGCLMAVVVVIGAAAFALYYLFSDQPETVSQIVPRFAYWFPFALLGLVTDVPFHVFDWQDRRLRVMLRLILWWMPRLVIVAFMINLPILQDLDPATTALVVLAFDGILAAFFLLLYALRKRIGMKDVRQNYDTYEDEVA